VTKQSTWIATVSCAALAMSVLLIGRPEEQALNLSAGRPVGMQPGGYDRGIVPEQAVAGLEVIRQVAKIPVFHAAGLPVDDQQAGRIAPIGRLLGDQVLGQGIVE
jgi:hypothetical protein